MQGFYIRNYCYGLGKYPPITVRRTLGVIRTTMIGPRMTSPHSVHFPYPISEPYSKSIFRLLY